MALYPLIQGMIEKYPDESARFEELQAKAGDPQHRGCYTCRFYTLIPEAKFVDVESLVDDVDGDWLPWDTEDVWVYCSEEPEIETPLKINCKIWQISDEYK